MGASVSSAVGGYPVDPYKRLVKPFSFYGAYHTNPINQWIHIVCVPVLLSTGLLFFSLFQYYRYRRDHHQGVYYHHPPPPAWMLLYQLQ